MAGPSKSKKQARFMAACAHGAGWPSCPPVSVAKEFNRNDTGKQLLKAAVREINRNGSGNRFAKGLRGGGSGRA
jgi:hypothetical protein